MHACMVGYTYYETDNRVRRYAEALAKRGDKVDVVALSRAGQSDYSEMNGVRVFRIQQREINEKGKGSYLWRLLKFLFKSSFFLTRTHFRDPYDVIHIHSVPDFEVYAALFPKLMGAKVILDIHDLVPEFYLSKFGNSKWNAILYKALVFTEKLSIGFSHHMIISNHLWADKITRSVVSEKCTPIINYPDPSMFFPRNKGRSGGNLIIMYPGTISWHQGLDIAIKGFSLALAEDPGMEFHIYGEGPAREQLEEFVRKDPALKEKVFFHGLVPSDIVAEKMAGADVGIIPKRNDPFGGEAFSTKTLEFMSLGVPIIVSRTKIDQYYFNSSLVEFFEPENEKDLAAAILRLASDKGLRQRLSESGLKYAQENSWDVKKQIYLNLVDRLVNRTPTASV